jgi:hypothetical protein
VSGNCARLLGFRRVKEGGTFVLPSFFVYIGSGPGFGQIAQGENFKLSEQELTLGASLIDQKRSWKSRGARPKNKREA